MNVGFRLLLALAFTTIAAAHADVVTSVPADSDQPVIALTATPVASAAAFRDEVVGYASSHAGFVLTGTAEPDAALLNKRWSPPLLAKTWALSLSLYVKGKLRWQGRGSAETLSEAIQQAVDQTVQQVREQAVDGETVFEQWSAARMVIAFDYLPDRRYAMLAYQGRGLELTGDRVAVRALDADVIEKQLDASRDYLLRAQNALHFGWYQRYWAESDRAQTHLRSIYTASTLLGLMRLQEHSSSPEVSRRIEPTAAFLLSMQVEDGEQAGAFRYSLNPKTGSRGCRLMAGTTSKVIFTLLALHERDADRGYLQAAVRAGDWLLGRVKPDGRVFPMVRCSGEQWKESGRQSTLYSGQVLSALSRLYAATGDTRYRQAARQVATRQLKQLKDHAGFVGDDYRGPNSISTSWVAMSLHDFALVAEQPEPYDAAVRTAMSAVMERQIRNPTDIFDDGRFLDTMSASGNGWMAEVLGRLYNDCQAKGRTDCLPYRVAMLHVGRWLVQNAYDEANSYRIPNPARANGGMIGSIRWPSVRTDSVGHALNGLLDLSEAMRGESEPWLLLPERRFEETLVLLREIPQPDAPIPRATPVAPVPPAPPIPPAIATDAAPQP